MPTYEDLAAHGLSQSKIEELLNADEGLVDTWLVAIKSPPPAIKNPLGWMIASVRKGEAPPDPEQVEEGKKRAAIVRAENMLRNVGYLYDRESELDEALFGYAGILRDYPDEAVRSRLLAEWSELRPKGEEVEAAFLARAERFRLLAPPAGRTRKTG